MLRPQAVLLQSTARWLPKPDTRTRFHDRLVRNLGLDDEAGRIGRGLKRQGRQPTMRIRWWKGDAPGTAEKQRLLTCSVENLVLKAGCPGLERSEGPVLRTLGHRFAMARAPVWQVFYAALTSLIRLAVQQLQPFDARRDFP